MGGEIDPAAHVGLVYMLAQRAGQRYLRDPHELASHGAIGLMKACRTFDPSRGAKPSTWIAANVKQAISHGSRVDGRVMFGPSVTLQALGRTRMPEREGLEYVLASVDPPEITVDDADMRRRVRRAMRRLPRCWQAMLLLVYCRRWPMHQVAERAGSSVTTLRKIHRVAMSHLRRMLAAEIENV